MKDEAVVKWFLDNGADVNLRRSTDALSFLEVAAGQSTPAVASLLICHGAQLSRTDVLHKAVEGGTGVPMLKCLLDHGADIDALGHFLVPPRRCIKRANSLGTALFVAAYNGKPDDVRYLLQRGADPAIPTTEGITAAEIAKVWATKSDLAGWNECVELIEQKLDDRNPPGEISQSSS